MKCPQCQAENCTEIRLDLKEDETVDFFSCRRCEAKWWQREGDTIELDEVLNLATRRAPQRK